MATMTLPPLSASVTRILSLSGFPPQLKTRDLQSAFSEWESLAGGFKIKWVNDTSALIVFADAGVAKRAYLSVLSSPPPIFTSPTSTSTAVIRPYDGADAQNVIQAVNSRTANHRSHQSRASIASGTSPIPPPHVHARANSIATGPGAALNKSNGVGYLSHSGSNNSTLSSLGREPSPTLPNIPNQPTLNALISSSLSDLSGKGSPIEMDREDGFSNPGASPSPPISADAGEVSGTPSTGSTPGGGAGQAGLSGAGVHPAVNVVAAGSGTGSGTPPKIGDPGRRMVGAALGIRHPGLGHRSVSSGNGASAEQALKEVQKAVSTMSVSD